MKALITGSGGQLGRALLMTAPPGIEVVGLSHADLDIADSHAVGHVFSEIRPDTVINAAAFTDVDGAEAHPEIARRSNTDGPAILAAACAERRARLLHISTDFVFDGRSAQPYLPDDRPVPLGIYGASKLAGELRVQAALGASACVVRTSWLYGRDGSNFVLRMLELMRTRKELRVVLDQVGAPTWTQSLAPVTWQLALSSVSGIYHWCDSGLTSRYDFAVAISEEAAPLGLLGSIPAIIPITAADYPMRAKRPPYSVLDKRATEAALGRRAEHWRVNLRDMLRLLKGAERA